MATSHRSTHIARDATSFERVRAAPREALRWGMAAPLHIVRKPLVNTAAIRADWVHYAGLSRDRTAEIHEPETQILITLGGAFHYHVGRARRLVDANRIAF